MGPASDLPAINNFDVAYHHSPLLSSPLRQLPAIPTSPFHFAPAIAISPGSGPIAPVRVTTTVTTATGNIAQSQSPVPASPPSQQQPGSPPPSLVGSGHHHHRIAHHSPIITNHLTSGSPLLPLLHSPGYHHSTTLGHWEPLQPLSTSLLVFYQHRVTNNQSTTTIGSSTTTPPIGSTTTVNHQLELEHWGTATGSGSPHIIAPPYHRHRNLHHRPLSPPQLCSSTNNIGILFALFNYTIRPPGRAAACCRQAGSSQLDTRVNRQPIHQVGCQPTPPICRTNHPFAYCNIAQASSFTLSAITHYYLSGSPGIYGVSGSIYIFRPGKFK